MLLSVTRRRFLQTGAGERFVEERYAGWSGPRGTAFFAADATLASIAEAAIRDDVDPRPRSGRQEYLENIVGGYA